MWRFLSPKKCHIQHIYMLCRKTFFFVPRLLFEGHLICLTAMVSWVVLYELSYLPGCLILGNVSW